MQSTVPAGTWRSSVTRASSISSFFDSPSKSGAPRSASAFLLWLSPRTGRVYNVRTNCETAGVQAETRYAKSGELYIAYQVLGDGPIDLVFAPGYMSHLEQNQWWPPYKASSSGSRRSRA